MSVLSNASVQLLKSIFVPRKVYLKIQNGHLRGGKRALRSGQTHTHTPSHTHTEIQTNKALGKHKAINIKVNLSEGLNVYSSSNTERTRALLYALTLLLERVLDNRTRLCCRQGRERGGRQSQLTTSPTLTQCYCPRSQLCH